MRPRLLLVALVFASLLAPANAEALGRHALRESLHAASALLGGGSCSGVLAEAPDLVFTAQHCLQGRADVDVRFPNGESRTGTVVASDPVADQAVLVLDEPVHVAPLVLARRWPVAGTVLYFEGNPSRPRPQEIVLERLDTCPSLPRLSRALFTSLQGTPGDSGAPLVDAAARVVGLVHGGAQCQIATPSVTLAHLVD